MKKYSRKHVFDSSGELLPLEQRTYMTNEGYNCILVDGGSKGHYVTIQIDEYVVEKEIQQVKNGKVKYPLHKSLLDVGFVGIGDYSRKNNKKYYDLWKSMLTRAYSKEYHIKSPTYKVVTVCDEWNDFQVFCSWLDDNYVEGYDLDKDLLSGESKIYSPSTCLFIPTSLNNFLTNIKSNNKSGHIGVYWSKSTSKWVTYINSIETGKCINLGIYNSKEEASNAYNNKRAEYSLIWKERMKDILPTKAIENIK